MEEFEEKALTTAPHPPKFWARYVDDTGVVTKKLHEEELFNHINRQHPSIKFTIETEVDNSLPMLDLKLNRTNNTIIADIYRKPTHTDHYLQWSSHHPVQQKLGIVCTLMHRADTIISDNNLKKVEKEKIRTALRNCGYPEWALKEGEQRGKKRDTERKEENTETEKPVGYAVLPYVKGLSERLQRIFRKHKISLHHKAGHTLRQELVRPKDKLEIHEKCGVVYETECGQCGESYIGETGRSMGERAEEHDKSIRKRDCKSALSEHQDKTGHVVTTKPLLESIKIIDSEPKERHRKIKEAINIMVRKPSLNRNDGTDLPELYLPLLKEEVGTGGTDTDQLLIP